MSVRFVFSIVTFGIVPQMSLLIPPISISMSPECGCDNAAQGTISFPQLGGGFICQQGCVSQQGTWKMARVGHSACSPAGNNPEITCRDDAVMILLMKKPGLSSAATDWKEPVCLQYNGPRLDNPSESMQPMRPPIWSWNVRRCHVWHLLEHWLCPSTQGSAASPIPFFKTRLWSIPCLSFLAGTLACSVCHETLSDGLICLCLASQFIFRLPQCGELPSQWCDSSIPLGLWQCFHTAGT